MVPRSAKGSKDPTGHPFALDLRQHRLFHLTVSAQQSRRQEHDLRPLERLETDTLRLGARTGRKVLYVWDRAGIDFPQWHRWKHSSGIYFLSREKDNIALEVIGENAWDKADALNAGTGWPMNSAPRATGSWCGACAGWSRSAERSLRF